MLGDRLSRTAALILCCAVLSAPQSSREQLDEAVASVADDVLAKTSVAGISVAIGRGGEVVLARGFGVADLETGRALNVRAVMDMGSVAKQMTAAAVLKAVANGTVGLDEPISRYLPGWKDAGPAITIRQLLNHTSGIEDPPFSEANPEPRFLEPVAADRLLAFIQAASRRFDPLESWLYSNAGYQLLGLVLEAVHRKPYAAVIDETIARPIGLESLTWCDKKTPIENRVRDYIVRDGKPTPIPPIDVSWFGGAGSLCASASDLVRWEQALWSDRVIPASLRAAMHEPAKLRAGKAVLEVDYGFGRAFGTYFGHRKIGHLGSGAGITAALAHYPDDDLIVAVMVNTNGLGIPQARGIEARIAAAVLGLEAKPPTSDVPVSAADADRWAGTYDGGPEATFTACEGEALCASLGKQSVRLRHYGGGRFAGPRGPSSELRFEPAGARAEWIVEAQDGMHANVWRRIK